MKEISRSKIVAVSIAIMTVALALPGAHAVTVTVTNTFDSGPGSLRQAILDANADNAFCGTINFNIDASTDPGCNSGTGVCTIKPLSELPAVGQCATINGYTQPGAVTNSLVNDDNAVLKIVLDGSMAGADASGIVGTNDIAVLGLVINRFDGNGIDTSLTRARTFVAGCFIGTDVSGTTAAGNGGAGVRGVDVEVGGFGRTWERNVISGNRQGISTSGGTVLGNFIGTDRHGTAALSNFHGVIVAGNREVRIQNNVISGNGGDGIQAQFHSGGATVEGNRIGVGVDGSALGNGEAGVNLAGETENFIIGGLTADSDNIIAYNGGAGVEQDFPLPFNGNTILRNSIFCNGSLGIDYFNGILLPNDLADTVHIPPFPTLTSVTTKNNSTTIQGVLSADANTGYLLQFYADSGCGPSGHPQGEFFLDFLNVTTDGNGIANFTEVVPALAPGWVVTATTTDPFGRTGPFSSSADLALTKRANVSQLKSGQNLTYTLTASNRGPDTASFVFLTDPLPTNTTFVSAMTTQGDLFTPAVGASGTVTNDIGILAIGSNATVTITVRVNTRVPPKGKAKLTNTALVSSSESDLNSANNTASVTTTVVGNTK